jgi:hypothetical protein
LTKGEPSLALFAEYNFGDHNKTWGPTEAIRLKFVEWPKAVRLSALKSDPLFLKLAIENRIDRPVWIAADRTRSPGLTWHLSDSNGRDLLAGVLNMNDSRIECNEFSSIPGKGEKEVTLKLHGRSLAIDGHILRIQVEYFMPTELLPLPPDGVVPVFGHAMSDAVEIAIEPG